MRASRSLGFCAASWLGVWPAVLSAQQAPAATDLRPVVNEVHSALPATIEPTWDTRTDARTVYFNIPAPRGQITDRNGLPMAQSRLGYHLDLNFPPGDEMSDSAVVGFVKTQLVTAQGLLHRPLEVTTSDVLDHYHNRRMLPMDIATYLSPEEIETVRTKLPGDPNLALRPVYLRFYPNGTLRRAHHRLQRQDGRPAARSPPAQRTPLARPRRP